MIPLDKNMLQRKMKSLKKLATKIKIVTNGEFVDKNESLLIQVTSDQTDEKYGKSNTTSSSPSSISPGRFTVYVGEERLRFTVKTKYLTHPLLKMLLEKASNEFGHEYKDGLIVVPCSVLAFQEVLNAVECSQGGFHFGELVDEFL